VVQLEDCAPEKQALGFVLMPRRVSRAGCLVAHSFGSKSREDDLRTHELQVCPRGAERPMGIGQVLTLLTTFTGFLGASVLVVDVGVFSLFPHRVLLIFLSWVMLIGLLRTRQGMRTWFRGVAGYAEFLLVWLLYALCSIAWSVDPLQGGRYTVFLLSGILVCFGTIRYTQTEKSMVMLYRTWLIGLAVFVIAGIDEQYFQVNGGGISSLLGRAEGASELDVFGSPNEYATLLSLAIPFALTAARYLRSHLAKAFWVCVSFGGTVHVIVASSRANLLALILQLTVLVTVLTPSVRRVRTAGVAVGVFLLVLVAVPNVVESCYEKVGQQLESVVVQARLETGSVGVRMNLVRNGLNFLVGTYGFGVGAGNGEVWMGSRAVYDTQGILSLHNWWLEILVDYGIWIFAGYMLCYIHILWSLWKEWRVSSTRNDRMISEALVLSMVGFAVASVSSSSIMALTPQWLLLAFALAFLNRARRKREVAR